MGPFMVSISQWVSTIRKLALFRSLHPLVQRATQQQQAGGDPGRRIYMLAAYPQTIPESSYSSYGAVLPQHRMIARARSYTSSSTRSQTVSPTALGGGADGRSRACSCDRGLRRCASEGGYVAARPTPWTCPAPQAVPLPARASAETEGKVFSPETADDDAPVEPRQRKVLRPSAPAAAAKQVAAPAPPVDMCPAPAVAVHTAVSALPKKKVARVPAGKLNKLSIVQAQQLAALGGLCHDIGMAEDPNERWREHHEDTAIVLLRLHRTARVGTTRSGGVLVPQRTKTTTRARSSSTGHTKVEQPPPASPLVSQKSQGPATGLVRQKSTPSGQRKSRSMTDVYGFKPKPLSSAALCTADPPVPEPLSSPGPEAAGVRMMGSTETSLAGDTPLLEQDDMIFAGLFDGHGATNPALAAPCNLSRKQLLTLSPCFF